jgi:ssDNA-binding Zn-finger/Zn-ribbon topoisomerase 1
MHPEVLSDHPGECPKCGMTLVKQKITAKQKKMLEGGNYVKLKD